MSLRHTTEIQNIEVVDNYAKTGNLARYCFRSLAYSGDNTNDLKSSLLVMNSCKAVTFFNKTYGYMHFFLGDSS